MFVTAYNQENNLAKLRSYTIVQVIHVKTDTILLEYDHVRSYTSFMLRLTRSYFDKIV